MQEMGEGDIDAWTVDSQQKTGAPYPLTNMKRVMSQQNAPSVANIL